MLNKQTQDSLPQWNSFSFKRHFVEVKGNLPQVTMGHYLIFFVHEEVFESMSLVPNRTEPKLIAFDLRDNSIQEAGLDPSLFPEKIIHFTFNKYKDNQIIKFGGCLKNRTMGQKQVYGGIARITIESFKPFEIKCEEIEMDAEEDINMEKYTAQIYNDCLYVYGGRNERFQLDNEKSLRSFDLNTSTWKVCQSSGEKPELRELRSSVIIHDNLYIYGGKRFMEDRSAKDIYVLNLTSMIWTNLEQNNTYLVDRVENYDGKRLEEIVYKDRLLTLGETKNSGRSETELLCCWDPSNNSWSTFGIEKCKTSYHTRNLALFSNLLISSGFNGYSKAFVISTLNLDHVDLPIPKSPQRSLFMNEEDSDIKLKVQGQIIPAHKQILMEKSNSFPAGGMVESQQDIIEIPDCDDVLLFKEFIRFLYDGEVKKDDDLAIKLFPFADKYLQNDLREKCLTFLKYNINQRNVFKILDFARQESIDYLRNSCVSFLKDHINPQSSSGLVQYLNNQSNPEYAQENILLRNKLIYVLANNYVETCKDQNAGVFEDFFIKNVNMDTIRSLVNFISGRPKKIINPGSSNQDVTYDKKTIKQEKEKVRPYTANLRDAIYSYVQKNLQILTDNEMINEFPHEFLVDLLHAITKKQDNNQKDLHEEERQQTSQ